MNIMINTFCNLHCPYCFAEDVINKYTNKNCMSKENFELCLQFLRYNNESSLRIIGGEPTLHPQFKEFLQTAIDYGFTEILIFTNGIFNEDLQRFLIEIGKRIHLRFLINVNEPRRLKEKYQIIKDNMYALMGYSKIAIGINFYDKNQEWEYIIDLAREFNIPEIRWSLTIPNKDNVSNLDLIQHIKNNKDNLLKFFEATLTLSTDTYVHEDCNALPICLFNQEEIMKILHCSPNVFTYNVCNKPVIDITPDLTVYKCFGFSNYDEKMKLTNFSNMDEIFLYFNTKFNIYKKALLFNSCKNCLTYKRNNNSCACWKYRKVEV